ncbi:MAG: CinA family protein [Spirochaetales bacterium]|nr:CinA family protein [Spirochaetales bacterium]
MKTDEIENLARRAVEKLSAKGMNLSVAESCTGGLIGKTVTDISGSSAVFYGGFILYSNEAKMDLAGVSSDTLRLYGAVSEGTVREMAEGTRQRCKSDFSLAVSGIAGPGGGTEEKPVGTVWVGLAHPLGTEAKMFHFSGNRDSVRHETLKEALFLLIDNL